jgi:hypothetical protein
MEPGVQHCLQRHQLFNIDIIMEPGSVADSWHFGVDPDPDPRIHASD